MVSSLSLSVPLSAANLCSRWNIHPSFMCLIIKGLWECSGTRAFAWVSSGKSLAFYLDVYGFMHGTTYCLIGHHSNDIVAVGRLLQRSARLRVNGCVRAWACFGIRVKTIKNWFSHGRSRVSLPGKPKQHICTVVSMSKKKWIGGEKKVLSDVFCTFAELSMQNSTPIQSSGWWEIIAWAPLIDWLPGIKFQTINTIKNPLKPLKPQRNGNHLTI